MNEQPKVIYGYKIVARINPSNIVMSQVYLLDDDDEEAVGYGIPVSEAEISVSANLPVSLLHLTIPLTPDICRVEIVDQ